MYILVLVLIIILSIFLSFLYSGFVLSPSIIIKVPWALSILFLFFSEFDFDSTNGIYLYFLFGLLAFDFGYLVVHRHNKRINWVPKNGTNVNMKLIKHIIIIESGFLIIYLTMFIKYIRNNFLFNFYYTIKYGTVNGIFSTPTIISYFINFSISFTIILVILYNSQKKIDKKILLIQVVIGSIFSLLTLGRTSVLLLLISLATAFVITNNFSNWKVIGYFFWLFILWFIFFVGYNILKYPYKIDYGGVVIQTVKSFVGYFSGSLVAFEKYSANYIDYNYGLNLFRFIFAILDKIGFQTEVKELVNPYISISSSSVTNVYTFYYFYVSDFGHFFALLMQMFLGSIYAYLYNKVLNCKPIWLYFYSLSIYPLIMQFFQDQFFSLTSTWIQFIIYGLIFFKTNMIYKNSSK